jgi:hypothetical protein
VYVLVWGATAAVLSVVPGAFWSASVRVGAGLLTVGGLLELLRATLDG